MNKRLLFIVSALVLTLGNTFSQNTDPASPISKISGTKVPPQQWDTWFNAQVEEFKKNHMAGKSQFAAYTIPVIFHILHNGATAGTPPNLPANRIQEQVNILNKIYNGQGDNPNAIAQYSNYASNPNIQFCLATADPTNIPIGEPGINRIDIGALFATNTNTIPTFQALQSFIDYTVKPFAIWDPTKYLNIFVSETSSLVTQLGYATFPAGTTLQGPFGAIGTGTTDGVWINTRVVGTATATPGPYIANYDKGKTLAREIGHWLGVRNIWGDANCGTDFCDDTPPHTGPNSGCISGGFPYKQNSCGPNLSPGGEMTMNIMDETYDDCRWMFTNDQVIRMQTAMSQCPFRWLLGTHGLCTPSVVCSPTAAALASFSFTQPAPCFGQAFTPVNNSTGCPAPTFTWVLTPNTATVTQDYYTGQPSFNLSSQGTYTLELIASNTIATTSYSIVFTTSVCPKSPTCLDTLKKIKYTDTLTVYSAPPSTVVAGCNVTNPGWLTGTNCYNDKEFAQYFTASSYSNIPNPQLGSVYVLFRRQGTKANSPSGVTYCNIWTSNALTWAPVSGVKSVAGSLSAITATVAQTWSTVPSPSSVIPWCGTSTYSFTGKDVYAYKYSFDPPFLLPTGGFHVGIEMPWATKSLGDSALIYSNTILNSAINDSTAFVRSQSNSWYSLKNKYGKMVQLAIMPEISCRNKVGLEELKNELEESVRLMPNPNNGQFSILVTLQQEQNLTFRVMNYMGQTLGINEERNVSSKVFDIDMSNNANGVYFVEISNGTQKTVKKLVINK